MTVDEIQKYNKIVVDTAKEIAQGYEKALKAWKWATFILAFLLGGMIVFYFLCPSNINLNQDNNFSDKNIVRNG